MRLKNTDASTSHLSYCSNIHAGESWEDLFPLLKKHVPLVKARVSPNASFGLGLRASMASITTLKNPEKLAEFRHWLEQEDIYVFTVNGFPYGAFHGTQVLSLIHI